MLQANNNNTIIGITITAIWYNNSNYIYYILYTFTL